jgi:hypothetical protein
MAAPHEAHHITKGKRIIVDRDHHYGQRTRRRERRLQSDFWAGGQNNIDAARAQVCRCDRTGVRSGGAVSNCRQAPNVITVYSTMH